jgi:hypothetical protein
MRLMNHVFALFIVRSHFSPDVGAKTEGGNFYAGFAEL